MENNKKVNFKCLNCGVEYEIEINEIHKDKMGDYATCKECNATSDIDFTDKDRKMNFDEMQEYVSGLGSNFYNAMIGEVVNIATIEEKELSINEIENVANRLCDSDELNNLIDEIILENI